MRTAALTLLALTVGFFAGYGLRPTPTIEREASRYELPEVAPPAPTPPRPTPPTGELRCSVEPPLAPVVVRAYDRAIALR